MLALLIAVGVIYLILHAIGKDLLRKQAERAELHAIQLHLDACERERQQMLKERSFYGYPKD